MTSSKITASSGSYKLFGPLFRHKPFDRLAESTEKSLTKARISTPGDVYLSYALWQSILALLMLIPFAIALRFLGLITLIQSINNAFFIIGEIITYSPILVFLITLFYFYFKPQYDMIARASDIDQNIHHASAFLYAMTKSGLQPTDALDRLGKSRNIYGLISDEFGIAIKRVNCLGESLPTALKYVANTTSSKKLKEFIFSFILANEQSVSATAFFKSKFDEYFEKEKRENATISENLSILGEMATVIVAVTPTLVLATGVSLGVLNPSIINICNIYLILALPLSAILILLYVKAVLPSPKLISVTKATFEIPLMENIDTSPQPNTLENKKELNRRELLIRFKNALAKPVTMVFMYPWFFPLVASIVAVAVFAILYLTHIMASNQLIVGGLLAACLIALIPHEIRNRYATSVERRIPDFLRGLAETVEREGSVIKAIELVLKSRLGLLGREMFEIKSTKLGVPLKRALLMIEYHTASVVLKRTVSLMIIASESTKNMKDILLMAAEDADAYIRLRRERLASLVGMLMAMYISFGVYVYTYRILKTQFITSFGSVTGGVGGIGFNTTVFSSIMVQGYYAGLVLAVFLGLIIGEMVEGSIYAGLKHSFVMLVIALVLLGWHP